MRPTSQRRLGIYHGTSLQVRLSFANGYSGALHLYAVDWDNLNRRETVSVASGGNTQTIALTTNFSQGAWLHFPVTVPAGGSAVTVTKTAGPNGVLSGLFLGGAGPPPPPPPPPPFDVAPQGVGWAPTARPATCWRPGTDRRQQRPGQPAGRRQRGAGGRLAGGVVVVHHRRARPRCADESQRRLGIYHGTSLRVRLSFANGYSGALHLYAVDWDNLNRRETVSVASGGNTQTIALTTNFSQVPGCTSRSVSRPVAR